MYEKNTTAASTQKFSDMKPTFRPTATVFSLFFGLALLDFSFPGKKETEVTPLAKNQKIQVAILLDVSGSMNGLIDQAKEQLWNMVSVMGKVKCEQGNPLIEIALYEYGRTTNDQAAGYVKQISGFSSDLDRLSQSLFSLNTDGGDEYCGQVILTSLNDLAWDGNADNYKVIFIAGNEDFHQGSVKWTEACKEAKKKGVIVNTIYCGDKEQGIREHWNLVGECGNGSYSNINHNASLPDISTPYDSLLFLMNTRLNGTYVSYGYDGAASQVQQVAVDKLNASHKKSALAARIAVKGNKDLYSNSSWDLVDAVDRDSTFIAKVDMKTLPDSLKNKTRAELDEIVTKQQEQRTQTQKEIVELITKREAYIAAERLKKANENIATLETEVEKIITEQVKRFNMRVEKN